MAKGCRYLHRTRSTIVSRQRHSAMYAHQFGDREYARSTGSENVRPKA